MSRLGAVALVFMFSLYMGAANAQTPKRQIWAYATLNAPSRSAESAKPTDRSYSVPYGRIGVSQVLPDSTATAFVEFEYASTPDRFSMMRAYATKTFVTPKSGTLRLTVGRHSLAALNASPNKRDQRVSRWPDAIIPFSGNVPGISVEYQHGPLTLIGSHFNESKWSSGFVLSGIPNGRLMKLVGFTEERIGAGFTAQGELGWLFNFFGGASFLSKKHEARSPAFAQYYPKLFGDRLRPYVQYDWGDKLGTGWLTGATLTWAKNSYVKCYYDWRDKQWRRSATFSVIW